MIDKNLKSTLIVVAFGVVLFAALMNMETVIFFLSHIVDLIFPVMLGLLIAFVLKMIRLYETTGGVPDTLIQCVLGGGLAELALTAWITVSKVKRRTEFPTHNETDTEGVG